MVRSLCPLLSENSLIENCVFMVEVKRQIVESRGELT